MTVIHGDCLAELAKLPDKSVDALITDPPYNINLAGWDNFTELAEFHKQAKRVVKPGGFYAFFGQMPTLADWHSAAMGAGFKFLEHVSWVKRLVTPSVRLSRSHESIFIYSAGKNRKFYQTKGPYEDVKLPGILVDIFTLEGLDRYVKNLWMKIENKNDQVRRGNRKQNVVFDRFPGRDSDRSPRETNFTNVWSFLPPAFAKRPNTGNEGHPTQKPLEIMKRLIEMLIPEGGVVLDPFAGSGTTAVAALELGREFILIEKEARFCEMAQERIAKVQEQQLKLAI